MISAGFQRPMTTLRSLLVVSPDSDDSLDRAASAGADALVLDLGNGADTGHRRAIAFLASGRHPRTFVRASSVRSEEIAAILDAVIPARPAGIVLAGAEGGADVTRLSALLRPREAVAGIDDGATRILAMATDSAAALSELGGYGGSSQRLIGIAWDCHALRQVLGAEDVTDVTRAARTATLIGAAAAGIAAIDRPFRDGDLTALAAEAAAARRSGFHGKLALDAAQVATINAAFSRPAEPSR